MTMEIYNMPQAARAAFEAAHQRRGKTGKRKPRNTPSASYSEYLLSAERLKYLAGERVYNKQRADDNREILASRADLFLYNLKKPRLTACRLQIAQIKDAADRVRIQRARSPERVRAAQMRHMNTVTYSILKERGIR